MNTKIEQITGQNQEIIENFFREAQRIIYSQASTKAKIKMLYGAKYWTDYFLQLNNLRMKEEFRVVNQ